LKLRIIITTTFYFGIIFFEIDYFQIGNLLKSVLEITPNNVIYGFTIASLFDLKVSEEDKPLYYGCSTCHKKINGTNCTNVSCSSNSGPALLYKLSITMIDATGVLQSVLFGSVAGSFLGLLENNFRHLSPSQRELLKHDKIWHRYFVAFKVKKKI